MTGVLSSSTCCQSMILSVFEHLQIIVLSKYLNTNAIFKVIFYSDDQRDSCFIFSGFLGVPHWSYGYGLGIAHGDFAQMGGRFAG